MKKRRSTRLIHEGRYVAEVDIELLEQKQLALRQHALYHPCSG